MSSWKTEESSGQPQPFEGEERDLVLGKITRDDPPLLPDDVTEVEALLISIDGPLVFRHYGGSKLAFRFRIVNHPLYEGVVLTKWVRWNPAWNEKRIPPSSELWKIQRIVGIEPKRGALRKSNLTGKLFEVEVRRNRPKDGSPGLYSQVGQVKRRLAG